MVFEMVGSTLMFNPRVKTWSHFVLFPGCWNSRMSNRQVNHIKTYQYILMGFIKLVPYRSLVFLMVATLITGKAGQRLLHWVHSIIV